MSNEDNVITLPEITIEGEANAQPINGSDWWADGFMKGFNAPDTVAERPLMINDELAASFFAGVESGKDASKGIVADLTERYYDSPQLVPYIEGGEAYEEVQRRYNEAWEALFHVHMPHTEVEGEPGPILVRPNIVIIPE
jgi:hypothetical protein